MLAVPVSASAQGGLGFGTTRSPGAVDSGCSIAASVLGGAAGMLVGGAAGALIERAIYSGNPDAGVTGLAVGMIAGAFIGIQVAPRACDERSPGSRRAGPAGSLGWLSYRFPGGDIHVEGQVGGVPMSVEPGSVLDREMPVLGRRIRWVR